MREVPPPVNTVVLSPRKNRRSQSHDLSDIDGEMEIAARHPRSTIVLNIKGTECTESPMKFSYPAPSRRYIYAASSEAPLKPSPLNLLPANLSPVRTVFTALSSSRAASVFTM
jgi:hypothetical protein